MAVTGQGLVECGDGLGGWLGLWRGGREQEERGAGYLARRREKGSMGFMRDGMGREVGRVRYGRIKGETGIGGMCVAGCAAVCAAGGIRGVFRLRERFDVGFACGWGRCLRVLVGKEEY